MGGPMIDHKQAFFDFGDARAPKPSMQGSAPDAQPKRPGFDDDGRHAAFARMWMLNK